VRPSRSARPAHTVDRLCENRGVTEERAAVEAQIRDAANASDWSRAATVALGGYGDEILGYLVAMTRDETDARDAFSLFAEAMWKDLPRFRWEATFRTWAYGIARSAVARLRRDPYRRRVVELDDAVFEGMVAEVRSRTTTFMRTESRDKLAKLRAELDPDDQSLLILRINRGLGWREIAQVMSEDEDRSAAAIDKLAAALRKRFERLKTELRVKAAKV